MTREALDLEAQGDFLHAKDAYWAALYPGGAVHGEGTTSHETEFWEDSLGMCHVVWVY